MDSRKFNPSLFNNYDDRKKVLKIFIISFCIQLTACVISDKFCQQTFISQLAQEDLILNWGETVVEYNAYG